MDEHSVRPVPMERMLVLKEQNKYILRRLTEREGEERTLCVMNLQFDVDAYLK